MADAQRKIQVGVDGMLMNLDKEHLRPLQKSMHLCAAKCCDDRESSMEAVQNCFTRCSAPTEQAQNMIQKEMEDFQGRLARCAKSCEDAVKDQITSDTKEGELSRFQKQIDGCMNKCADEAIGLIPKFEKRIKGNLNKLT